MLINLKNELWVGYILSQQLITELIGLPIEEEDDELTEHYISFLKSLSIRLDASQVSLFYNKVLPESMLEVLPLSAGVPSSEVLQPSRQHGQDERDEPDSGRDEDQERESHALFLNVSVYAVLHPFLLRTQRSVEGAGSSHTDAGS